MYRATEGIDSKKIYRDYVDVSEIPENKMHAKFMGHPINMRTTFHYRSRDDEKPCTPVPRKGPFGGLASSLADLVKEEKLSKKRRSAK